MASSLVLTGVKDIKKNTGTEMLRLNPKRGGDVFKLKRWWVVGGNGTVYTNATVFNVTTSVGTVKLAIESSMESNIRIAHDGSFGFTFSNANEISRAALFTDSFELIEHYVFPSISGGKIMTVTPSGGADRPQPAAVAFTGTTTLTGTAQVGETLTATASAYTGGRGTVTTNLLFQTSDTGSGGWSFLAGNPGTAGGGTATYTIAASQETKYIRASFQVVDDDGTVSSNTSATAQIVA